MTNEHNRLTKIVSDRLQTSELEAFERLLAESPGLYEITQLKQEPRNFSLKETKYEIQRGEQLSFFYTIAENLLPEMEISNESVKYYAALVGYYSVAIISNAIAELSIFHHYDVGNLLHSSSDGQKFEARINTINSRHSPKYFGLNKGVVSYTLVANHIPVNARIIGANEHESHFVFDILFNNTTDIQPSIHSTDTLTVASKCAAGVESR